MRSVLTALFLVLTLSAFAQKEKDIDGTVASLMRERGTPGVSLAVVRDGKIVYEKGYGLADIENKTPATAETVYEIGSITKQFTAALILQLEGEGKIKLDEPIRTYLPDMPESWKAVTVRHLLTHTSGIPVYTDVPAFFPQMREPPGPSGFLGLVADKPLDFPPGSDWKYNNSGYFVLGLLVEKITGQTFRQALKERILDPLGMTHTDMNDWMAIIPNRARGYNPDPKGGPQNTTYLDMGWPFAAGAMIATVGDLAKWDAALYTDKPLKQSALKEAWTPVTLSNGKTRPYGFGWALGELNAIPVIEHAGAINGFNADIIRVPSKRITVIVMCNAYPGIAEPIARQVLLLMEPSLKAVYKAIPDPSPDSAALHRAVLADLAKGTLSPDLFTDAMKARLFPAFVDQVHQLLGSLGKIESFDLIALESKDGLERRDYHATIGGQGVKMTVITDKSGKIAGFSLVPG